MLYYPTYSEKLISECYKELGIFYPSQIDIERICQTQGIVYIEKPIYSHFAIIDEVKFIVVDKRLKQHEKKEHFFHELVHVLLHSGIQTSMSEYSLKMQEREARKHSRYALIPFHMLKFVDLTSNNAIQNIIETFNVSDEISKERYEEIEKKLKNKISHEWLWWIDWRGINRMNDIYNKIMEG